LLFSGISTLDVYRIEVVTRVEYVPTLLFDSWSPAIKSPVSESAIKNLADIVDKDLTGAITGNSIVSGLRKAADIGG
jgi:hypothetical protein